jgi:imidazolonepropionase-like amidohydrolase
MRTSVVIDALRATDVIESTNTISRARAMHAVSAIERCARLARIAALVGVLALSARAAPALRARTNSANDRSPAHEPSNAGSRGAPGLALLAKKIVTVPPEGDQFIDDGVLLVRDGTIEAVGPARSTPIPAGYEVHDVGSSWLMPGLVDLHSHVGGSFDINDAVYLTNPGLRVHCSVVPANERLKLALAAGVTCVLYIPGSGVNCSGQGVLIKTGLDHYEEAVVRDPGSLKIAQAGNPEGWTVGVGRSFMNWDTRDMLRRGKAYAEQWQAYEEGHGEKPERNLEFDVFRELLAKRTQISTHTQMYQVVLTTITMLRMEFGFDVYIDHGEMAGYQAAELAQAQGVNAIIGPREIEIPTRLFIQWTGSNPEAILGIAAEYQKRGLKNIGFNTDAPVVPEEELPVQATTAAHYGFDGSHCETVRGLTIVPAMTAGIANRVGSLEVGKDADVLVIRGDIADPRSVIDVVYIEGKKVYDAAKEKRRW